MATFTKRGTSWFCQVRRAGHKSISRSFDTKTQAERWALSIESDMGRGAYNDVSEVLNTSLGDCIDRYSKEVTPLKKGADQEMYRVKAWLLDPLAKKPIGSIRSVDIAKWRDSRIKIVSANTVRLDLSLLSHVFTIAVKEWSMPLINPVMNIRKPKPGISRDRRLENGELNRILKHCSLDMRVFIILAIETAMRR